MIVRQTAELLELPISIRSVANEGSTFSIELPLAGHSSVPVGMMEFGAATFDQVGLS